jgi:hypothetical protein
MILAILLAKATAASLTGLRAMIRPSQLSAKFSLPRRTMEPEAGAIHPIKLNDIDPQAWLADVLTRLPDHPASRIAELLPWNWKASRFDIAA